MPRQVRFINTANAVTEKSIASRDITHGRTTVSALSAAAKP
jgi:hypothetical protein